RGRPPRGGFFSRQREVCMRSLARAAIVLAGLLATWKAAAKAVETLKQELEQMRRQFESMRDGYEKAINQLGERIKALESKQQPAVAAPPVQAPAPGAAPPSPPPVTATPAPSPPPPPATATPTPSPPSPPVTATPAPSTAPPPATATSPPASGSPASPPAPAVPSPPATAVVQAPTETPAPSLLDLVKPREPFALYQRRGPGQLLFDIGVAGDFIGDLTQNNVQQAKGGTFP